MTWWAVALILHNLAGEALMREEYGPLDEPEKQEPAAPTEHAEVSAIHASCTSHRIVLTVSFPRLLFFKMYSVFTYPLALPPESFG
jgi:hypothetical protein